MAEERDLMPAFRAVEPGPLIEKNRRSTPLAEYLLFIAALVPDHRKEWRRVGDIDYP